MILTTAALIAIATALATVETRSSDELLACAADRYKAARTIERVKNATSLTSTKGMGAISPANRSVAEAARLRAEGDDFRERAASTLSRRAILVSHGGRVCSAG